MALVYCYCIIQSEKEKLSSSPKLGFSKGGLYFVTFDDIAAVVSDVSRKEFDQKSIDKKARDLTWLSEAGRKHEGVVEYFMQTEDAVIPLKFCTIFSSEQRVKSMLKKNYASFKETFERIRGRFELGLVALRTMSGEESSSLSKRVRELKKKISQSKPGASYLLKKRIDEISSLEQEQEDRKVAKELFQRFRSLADDSVSLSGSAVEKGKRSSLILSAAFLVFRDDFKTFKEVFDEEKKKYAPTITLSLSGPWPPYNFCK